MVVQFRHAAAIQHIGQLTDYNYAVNVGLTIGDEALAAASRRGLAKTIAIADVDKLLSVC